MVGLSIFPDFNFFRLSGIDFSVEGIFISAESTVEEGAVIHAPAHISGRSHILRGACIMPFSYIEDSHVGQNTVVFSSTLRSAHVGDNCSVGPYAYMREGAYAGDNCRIGDFVEIKASTLGEGTKVAHLAYVGDATVGKNVNIGCGVVFCNYDGKVKSKITVGDGTFVGANCNLIAPLTVGAGAFIAAGTTVCNNLNEGDFCIGRSRQTVKEGAAAGRYRGGNRRET